MFEYMTAQEAAEKWNVSLRWVQRLCKGNRIEGVMNITVIVAPITSRIHTKAKLPTHTLINDFEGLDKNSIILLEQVRTIDKQRLRQYLGMIPDDIVARVDKALAISVALEKMKATDV